MTEAPQGWSWRPPPGWPRPEPGWSPPAGWQPDPSWPAAPPDWVWWEPTRTGPGKGMPWFLAAAAMFPLGLLLLVVGLMVPSLALVYLSILCNIIWIPLLIVGVVRLLRSRSAR